MNVEAEQDEMALRSLELRDENNEIETVTDSTETIA